MGKNYVPCFETLTNIFKAFEIKIWGTYKVYISIIKKYELYVSNEKCVLCVRFFAYNSNTLTTFISLNLAVKSKPYYIINFRLTYVTPILTFRNSALFFTFTKNYPLNS